MKVLSQLLLLLATITYVHCQNGTSVTNGTLLANITEANMTNPAVNATNPTIIMNTTAVTNATLPPNDTTTNVVIVNGTMAPLLPSTNDTIIDMTPVNNITNNSTQPPNNNIFDQGNSNGLTATDGNTTTMTFSPTMAPTAYINTVSNQICDQLDPGDVFIYVVASDNPDGIGFLALEDLVSPLKLFMTDNPWLGTRFGSSEGTVSLVVPPEGFPMGSNFGYGKDFGEDNDEWTTEQGNFDFGVSGDSLFLYCEGTNGTVNPLVGFNNAGDGIWAEPGLPESSYGAELSALPVELQTVGNVGLPHLDNYKYEGPTGVNKTELQAAMMDPENWIGEDEGLGDQSGSTSNHYLVETVIAFLCGTIVVRVS